jgi:hypothetical protein
MRNLILILTLLFIACGNLPTVAPGHDKSNVVLLDTLNQYYVFEYEHRGLGNWYPSFGGTVKNIGADTAFSCRLSVECFAVGEITIIIGHFEDHLYLDVIDLAPGETAHFEAIDSVGLKHKDIFANLIIEWSGK